MDSNVPHPMGPISLGVMGQIRDTYQWPSIPSNYHIVVLDLKEFNLSETNLGLSNITSSETEDQALKRWQTEISKHSGFILLFPTYTWSYCNSIKNSITILSPETWKRKPVMIMGYGKRDEAWDPAKCSFRTTKRKSFDMMRDFLKSKEMHMAKIHPVPEFPIYQDYWECWEKGTLGFHGGQQTELWESTAHNGYQDGVRWMIDDIEKSTKKR